MTIIAIDPGPTQSAYVVWDGQRIVRMALEGNEAVLTFIGSRGGKSILVIEKVASYGMAVGASVFETVYWSGRFAQAFGGTVCRVPRMTVKMHLCHDSRAKDANICQAIRDRFGGRQVAIGKKASPGPLYGVKKDIWQALALALTWHDQNAQEDSA